MCEIELITQLKEILVFQKRIPDWMLDNAQQPEVFFERDDKNPIWNLKEVSFIFISEFWGCTIWSKLQCFFALIPLKGF